MDHIVKWNIFWAVPSLTMVNVPGENEQDAVSNAIKILADSNSRTRDDSENELRMFMFALPEDGTNTFLGKDAIVDALDPANAYKGNFAVALPLIIAQLDDAGVISKAKRLCRALVNMDWNGDFVISMSPVTFSYLTKAQRRMTSKEEIAFGDKRYYLRHCLLGEGEKEYKPIIRFANDKASMMLCAETRDNNSPNLVKLDFAKKNSSYDRRRRTNITWIYSDSQ